MARSNPLVQLGLFGQSVWLDSISRRLLNSGELRRLIEEDHVRGLTSNFAIYEQAIVESQDYDQDILQSISAGEAAATAFEKLSVEDARRVADVFRSTYDREAGWEGFVSLAISPHLAYDTEGTIEEARRIWAKIGRPNVHIKVPATPEGLAAISQLICDGINVNVTHLFGLNRYMLVTDAYMEGLERRSRAGLALEEVASVASFYLSRIDAVVDPLLAFQVRQEGPKRKLAESLRGSAAVASAKVVHDMHNLVFGGERFRRLTPHGARVQRLLWASTGTTNPVYSDVKYIEPLIGAGTISAMPLETLNAYRHHGDPAPRLDETYSSAHRVLEDLKDLGIDLDEVAHQLEQQAISKSRLEHDKLMERISETAYGSSPMRPS